MLTLGSAGLLTFMAAHSPEGASTGRHSLLHPVPQEELRDLTTDRPDLTESAITVDAGHLQLEMDFGVLAMDRATSNLDLTMVGVNLKIGLWDGADLQLVLPPMGMALNTKPLAPLGKRRPLRPVGNDALVRFKYNVVGNDGGDFALGVMPFAVVNLGGLDPSVVVPLEAGLIVPMGMDLPADFSVSSMVQLEANHDGPTWEPGAMVSASVGHPLLVDEVGIYVESAALLEPSLTDSRVLLSSGITWGITPDIQFDAGLRVPVFGWGGAYEGFSGISIRR